MTMTRKQGLFLFLALLALLSVSAPLVAQDEPTVIADQLNNPRQLFYGADGTLYIAEAGLGGDVDATGSFENPVKIGATSRISMVAPDGTFSTALDGLASIDGGPENLYGAFSVIVDDEYFWIAMGEGPKADSYDTETYIFDALVAYDRETKEVVHRAGMKETAAPLNPSVPNNSNPVDLAIASDGTVYIVNAGCNCVQSWTEADGVQIAMQWDEDDNPVPTSIAIGPDGDIYVGFLTGFPWPTRGSRIERWSGGELKESYYGLTTVTDVLVSADGTIYAVEHGLTGEGYVSGRVVMASADGITPVMEGLNQPYGLAQDANGNLVVSIGSVAGEGAGQVIAVVMGATVSAGEPEATPEAEG
jgi:hypothetical protein